MQKIVLIIIAMVVNEVTANHDHVVNQKAEQVNETVALMSSSCHDPFGKWSEDRRQSPALSYCLPIGPRWPVDLFINFRAN